MAGRAHAGSIAQLTSTESCPGLCQPQGDRRQVVREQAPYHVVDGCCSILQEKQKGIVTATSSSL